MVGQMSIPYWQQPLTSINLPAVYRKPMHPAHPVHPHRFPPGYYVRRFYAPPAGVAVPTPAQTTIPAQATLPALAPLPATITPTEPTPGELEALAHAVQAAAQGRGITGLGEGAKDNTILYIALGIGAMWALGMFSMVKARMR